MPQSTPDAKFPLEVWDGRTSSTPDITTEKNPDIDLANRYRAEIRAIEETFLIYLDLFEKLLEYGPGDSVLGIKADGTELEYKVLSGGAGITIAHSVGGITITATASQLEAEADAEIKLGNPIYLKATGHTEPAQANNVATIRAVGLAALDTASGFSCPYFSEGQIERGDWTDITGAASLTPGLIYFLSAASAGKLTTTAPTTIGQYVIRIGRAITATKLDIEIGQPVLL